MSLLNVVVRIEVENLLGVFRKFETRGKALVRALALVSILRQ